MILQETTNNIEQIGEFKEQAQFKIKASKKAFALLSGLYSDLPLAIIRELAINGLDSHIAAGKKSVPIEIHIPNSLEPWLTIKDFGTGISHKDIYDIYTTYFESTKTNTNDQTGCFGIGSKVQMSYTDAFTTTSTTDGVKRTYNVFFNKEGVPCISLAYQTKTNECNGLEVQIPIKSSDFDKFRIATYQACKFFDVKPIITGGKIDWNCEKPDFEGSFWKSQTKLNQSYVIMGKVAYPIDTYKLDTEHYDIVRKAGLVIDFNIGELEITPAREALIYSEHTLNNLNAKIELVKKDFVSNVENTIKNSPNLLDAIKALYLLQNQWSFLNSSMLNGKVYWKGIEISEPRNSIKTFAPNILSYAKRVWGRKKINESVYPSLSNDALWYYDNLKRGSQKRITHYIRHHNNQNISINFVSENEMKELIKAGFPSSIFNPTSNLPQISVNRVISGVKNSRPKGVINIYNIGYNYRQSWESEKFDLASGTAPKYYIVKNKDNWNCVLPKLTTKSGMVIANPTSKESLGDVLTFLGISENDVRMVSETNAKHLHALGSKNLSTIIENKKIDVDIEKLKEAKALDSKVFEQIVKNPKFKLIDDQNDFKKFVSEKKSILDDVKQYSSILKYVYCNIEKKPLTFPSKMVELFYLACDSWQVGIERVMDTILEMNQTN